MAPRKKVTPQEATPQYTNEQLNACKRPADLARLLNVDGKRLRDALRKAGVYVSKGDTFTHDHKVMLVARFTKNDDTPTKA